MLAFWPDVDIKTQSTRSPARYVMLLLVQWIREIRSCVCVGGGGGGACLHGTGYVVLDVIQRF